MSTPIFITYNPKSEIAERTALRLQTISNLYGFTVHLPYRPAAQIISKETKDRILKCQFVVALCIGKQGKAGKKMKADLTFAADQQIPIVALTWLEKQGRINLPPESTVIPLDLNDQAKAQSQLFQINNERSRESRLGYAIVSLCIALLMLGLITKRA